MTQLAAQVALMEAVLVTLDDISPNCGALQRWLQVAGVGGVHDRPVSFRYGQWAVQTAPMAARRGFGRVFLDGCQGQRRRGTSSQRVR